MDIIWLDDNNLNQIDNFNTLKDRQLRANNQMIVDSPKVVLRMIEAGISPAKILASRDFLEQNRQLLASCGLKQCFIGEQKTLESIVGHRLHHGVIAIADRPKDTLIRQLGPRVLVLNGVNQAENVGTMVRTCDALGIESLIVDQDSISPYTRRAVRVSMGSVFRLAIYHSHDLEADLASLSESGFRLVGTLAKPGTLSIYDYKFSQKTALIIGSEGHGMTKTIKALCHDTITIPMRSHVDSLNAAAATSICLSRLSPYARQGIQD